MITIKIDGQCTGGTCRYYQPGRSYLDKHCIDNFLGVGRERPLTDTLVDQCEPFPNNGTSSWWFSFPHAGECKSSQAMGERGCTWGNVRPGVTIEAACLFGKLACSDSDADKVAKFHDAFQTCPPVKIMV